MRTSIGIVLSATIASSIAVSAADKKSSVVLPGERFFPEGIAASDSGRVFVGSFVDGSIIETSVSGQARMFAPAGQGGLVSVVGLKVDENGQSLHACSSDPGVSSLTGQAAPALVSFDIETSAVVQRVELPDGGFCNDIAQGSDGTIFVSDSFSPRILALEPGAEAFSVWATDPRFAGEGFNLNGIAMGYTALFAVKYNTGQLFRIAVNADGSAGQIREIPTSRPLVYPDGLLHTEDGFILTEGTGDVSRLRIRQGKAQITPIKSGLNVPTSTAVMDGKAVTVQSQFDHLFDPEQSAVPTDPFELAVYDLK